MAFSRIAICASTAATRASAASISSRRAPALSRASVSLAARDALARGLDPFPRHVPPRHGVVALLARAGVRGQQRLEALDVELGGGELGRGGALLGPGGSDLRLGLPDVLDAGPGTQQPKLGVGLIAFGACAGQRELRVGRVEAGDDARRRRRACPRRPRAPIRRPPTWAATCTSVASTCPDTRTRSAGGACSQPASASAAAMRNICAGRGLGRLTCHQGRAR